MGCRCSCWTNSINVDDFDMPEISQEDFKEIEKKIEKMTGFRPYKYKKIELRRDMHKINGTYYQYNKGCILYSIINNGHIDEQLIPDSMKYYVDHSHKEDQRNDTDFLKKIMSIIDLAQLWMNIGGECPYLEINLNEVRNRIYFVLKDFFNYEAEEESQKMEKENLEKEINDEGILDAQENKNIKKEQLKKIEENITNIKKAKTDVLKKVSDMTWQSKDYFELLGKIKIEYTPLNKISEIKDNPSIKNAINKNIINKRDIIKYGRHCFIFDEVIEKDSMKQYSFQDSLAYFRKDDKNEKNYNNCNFDTKGYVFANEDSKFINITDPKEREIGIVKLII